MIVNSFLYCEPFGLGTVRAVADQDQLRRDLLANAFEDLNYVGDPLHRAEIGKMNQDALVVRSILTPLFPISRGPNVLIAIDEVRNDLNVILDVENIEGTGAQILR